MVVALVVIVDLLVLVLVLVLVLDLLAGPHCFDPYYPLAKSHHVIAEALSPKYKRGRYVNSGSAVRLVASRRILD